MIVMSWVTGLGNLLSSGRRQEWRRGTMNRAPRYNANSPGDWDTF
jgi:hypothetical protein